MKKVILAFAVVSVFAACNNSGTDAKATDTTKVDTSKVVPVDTAAKVAVDTAKAAK